MNKVNLCSFFMHKNTPDHNLALTAEILGVLLEYEGGILRRSSGMVDLLSEATGTTPPPVIVTGSWSFFKDVKTLQEIPEDISKKWIRYSIAEISVILTRVDVGTRGLLISRVRPRRNETMEGYNARANDVLRRVAEELAKGLVSTQKETEAAIRKIIHTIGHAELLRDIYKGDVEWFCRDFWPGITPEGVVLQYSLSPKDNKENRSKVLSIILKQEKK